MTIRDSNDLIKSAATYILNYAGCRKIIDAMSFGNSSTIFCEEKEIMISFIK